MIMVNECGNGSLCTGTLTFCLVAQPPYRSASLIEPSIPMPCPGLCTFEPPDQPHPACIVTFSARSFATHRMTWSLSFQAPFQPTPSRCRYEPLTMIKNSRTAGLDFGPPFEPSILKSCADYVRLSLHTCLPPSRILVLLIRRLGHSLYLLEPLSDPSRRFYADWRPQSLGTKAVSDW